MGQWISSLMEVFSSLAGYDRERRILMLGLDGAGKTTILYQLKLNEQVTSIPTIGFNVETLSPCKGLTFTVWDLGGQAKIRPLWDFYYLYTEGIFFVVDSSDIERLAECRETLAAVLSQDDLRGVPLVVMANKQDMPQALTISEITEKLDLHKLGAQRDWYIQGTSGNVGIGIYEAMEAMAKFIKGRGS